MWLQWKKIFTVHTVGVSFSGSSVLNRVYNFTFLRSHNFRWFRAPSLECVKTQTYVLFLVFWIRPAWSTLEQGKKLQHFLLDRVARFTSFVFWTGSGFRLVGQTPLPKFLLSTHPGGCSLVRCHRIGPFPPFPAKPPSAAVLKPFLPPPPSLCFWPRSDLWDLQGWLLSRMFSLTMLCFGRTGLYFYWKYGCHMPSFRT